MNAVLILQMVLSLLAVLCLVHVLIEPPRVWFYVMAVLLWCGLQCLWFALGWGAAAQGWSL